MTPKERQNLLRKLNEWSTWPNAPTPENTAQFRESVLAVFERSEERERNSRNCAEGLTEALKQTQKALDALSATHAKGYSNAQTRYLWELLEKVCRVTWEPKEKGEIHKAYHHAASDSWMRSVLTANKKKARSENVRLIFDLEALWFSEFGERPNTSDEHPFYVFAGYLMDDKEKDPNSVKRQRSRTVPPE